MTEYNLLPLKLRFFTRLSKFIFKLIKISKSALSKNFIKNNTITRTYYLLPSFHRNQGKFSFRTIATKLLNDFIFVKLESDNLNFNLAENQTVQKIDDFVINIYERNVKNWSSLWCQAPTTLQTVKLYKILSQSQLIVQKKAERIQFLCIFSNKICFNNK